MAILLGLGVLWIITELVHKSKNDEAKKSYSVAGALQRIDVPTLLFFLGILLAVAALEGTRQLHLLGNFFRYRNYSDNTVSLLAGASSAVIDNVPLVAALKGMYNYRPDHYFWLFVAYTSGTGGSMLLIGSAAGVAAMGMEKMDFFAYARRIGWLAALGFLGGAGAYMLQSLLY
jgi:Na+/H+ antiporter NhaD/arsenite permease-like protein